MGSASRRPKGRQLTGTLGPIPHPPCLRRAFEPESLRSLALTLEGNVMNSASQSDGSQPKLSRVATASGVISAFVTAGAVSWSTPDGNLVVTLVPALAVGVAVFGLISWRSRRGESE